MKRKRIQKMMCCFLAATLAGTPAATDVFEVYAQEVTGSGFETTGQFQDAAGEDGLFVSEEGKDIESAKNSDSSPAENGDIVSAENEALENENPESGFGSGEAGTGDNEAEIAGFSSEEATGLSANEENGDNAAEESFESEKQDTDSLLEAAEAPVEGAEEWCGHYYKVYDNVKSPSAAAAYCNSVGGYLATITSHGENDIIQGMLANKSSRRYGYTIGGSRNEGISTDFEYQYSWSGGEKNILSLGDVGQRHLSGYTKPLYMGEGDQLAMSGTRDINHSFGWIWYDPAKTEKSFGFICEWGDSLNAADCEITLDKDRFVYNAQVQKPGVTVKYGDVKLEENCDYVYEFSNNINVGKAKCTIKGIGRFFGEKTVTFDIVPEAVKNLRGDNTLSTYRQAYGGVDRNIEVAWDGLTTTDPDGYVLWYSKDKNFTTYEERDLGKELEYYGNPLERGSTYYVKVRAYKGTGDQRVDGEWSDVLSVKMGKQILVDEMWGFHNASATVTLDYYFNLYPDAPATAISHFAADGGRLGQDALSYRAPTTGGLCFGMVTSAVVGIDCNTPGDFYGLTSANEVKDFEQTANYSSSQLGMTLKDALIYSFLTQSAPDIENEKYNRKNNLYGLYNAVVDCQKGTGSPVVLGCWENYSRAHALLAVGITEETDQQVKIALYDPNRPNDKEAILWLIKENGAITGYSYSYGEDHWAGQTNMEAENGDMLTYFVTAPKTIANKLKTIGNSTSDAKDKVLLYISRGSSDFNVSPSALQTWVNKQNFDPWKRFDAADSSGTTDSDGYAAWVNKGRTLSFKDVPAGVTISAATSSHLVSVSAVETSDITINVGDTSANKVTVTSANDNRIITRFQDFGTSISKPVKSTTLTLEGSAGTTVNVSQTSDNKLQLNGVKNASYARQEGVMNTENGSFTNPSTEEISTPQLEEKKSYQISKKDSDVELAASSKNNSTYDEVIQTTAAGGHAWDAGQITTAATCGADGVKTYTCTICKATKTETIPATGGHTWDAGQITTAATCMSEGVKTYTCTVCGTTKTETVAKTDHSWGQWTTASAATTTAAEKQTRSCQVCGAVENREYGQKLEIKVPQITLNASSLKLKKGQQTSALKVTSMGQDDSVVSVKSSNTKVLKVVKYTAKGIITLKAQNKTGSAKLTVTTANGATKQITVKVQKSAVKTTKITGISKKLTLKKGQKKQLSPVISPITSSDKVTYKTSNKKIVTVTAKGKITAKKKGKATITVKSGSKTVKCQITVK